MPFPLGVVARSLKPQIHVNTNGRRRDDQRPYQTTSGPPSSMSRRSNSTGPPRRSETLRFSITPEHPGSSTSQIKTAATALKSSLGQIGPTALLAARIKTQHKTKPEARPGELASPICGTRQRAVPHESCARRPGHVCENPRRSQSCSLLSRLMSGRHRWLRAPRRDAPVARATATPTKPRTARTTKSEPVGSIVKRGPRRPER